MNFQNITSPYALKLLPDKPLSEGHCVLGASLAPCAGGYPLFELFLGAWPENGYQSDESVPESNLETCLLLCLLHKEAIHDQCGFVFTTALLCLACVQHFMLHFKILRINSSNSMRFAPISQRIKLKLVK